MGGKATLPQKIFRFADLLLCTEGFRGKVAQYPGLGFSYSKMSAVMQGNGG